jgi:hypothetical protein
MADFDARVRESRAQVTEAQGKIAELLGFKFQVQRFI